MTPSQRELRDALADMPARVAAAASLRDETGIPVAAGEWTAREVVLHMVAVEIDVWQPRLAALQTQDFPSWPWVEPGPWDGPGGETSAGAVDVYRRERGLTVASIEALGDSGWERRGLHATFGELDVAALMRIALDHDEEHLAQIGATT